MALAEIMSKQARVTHPISSLLAPEAEGFDSLAELALDMRWPWNQPLAKCGCDFMPRCGNSHITFWKSLESSGRAEDEDA